jgi:YHS domain-containing protein
MIPSQTLKSGWLVSVPLLSLLLLLFSLPVRAESDIYTGYFSDLAISGYDSVAYFTEGKPVEGNDKFSLNYKGAQWQFSSQANLEAFTLAPDKYAPQYGGYCAWAVAHDNTAKGEPDQWYIHEGKLYLNYNADIREKWLKDKEALIKQADTNWPTVLN